MHEAASKIFLHIQRGKPSHYLSNGDQDKHVYRVHLNTQKTLKSRLYVICNEEINQEDNTRPFVFLSSAIGVRLWLTREVPVMSVVGLRLVIECPERMT